MLIEEAKRWFVSSAINSARGLGIDIQKIPDLDNGIKRLQSIQDPVRKLGAAQALVRKHPNHPKPHLELASCLHALNDPREFEQFDRYGEIRRDWLKETGLGVLGMEFVWPGMVVGSLGNHYAIEILLQANLYGLRTAPKPTLLLPPGAQTRNPALFEYFKPHLCVIRNEESIRALGSLESLLTLPLGMCLPLDDGCSFLDFSANSVEIEKKKRKTEAPPFSLSDLHRERGMRTLEELGLPRDAWYVTLHVRQPGYRGETISNTTENWRNANPKDYLAAIERVVKDGGWVFRMGDPSMTPLPEMPQVIDYANHPIRSDWMDVFLGATCRFLIGTASGYLRIPRLFGTPVIFTNSSHTVVYFSLRDEDLFLPRLLRKEADQSYLSFRELMSPPTSGFWSMDHFRKARLQWVDNTPEDLEGATCEMLERTAKGASVSNRDDGLQRRFFAIAEECGLKYGRRAAKAFAPISQDFLSRNANLL